MRINSQLRSSITKLKEGLIEGITWEQFENTFDTPELKSMELQKDKVASIKQVVSLFNELSS